MRPPQVEIVIDEVVLAGVSVPDVEAFRAEVAAALTALASAHGARLRPGEAAVLHGVPITASEGDGLGSQVARSVWGSIAPAASVSASTGRPGGGHVGRRGDGPGARDAGGGS